jgi:formylglycine-generating enzyme required for sulfatase activity
MKRTIIKIILLNLVQIMATICYSQQKINITGIIKDSIDQTEVPFAMVAVSGIDIAIVADKDGSFTICLPAEKSAGTLTITCMGYEKKVINIADIKASNPEFLLHRKEFSFHEITVSPKKKREITAAMIEKMMAKISDTFYMSKYKTSLYLYHAFLEDICMSDPKTCEEAGFHYNDKYPEHQFGYHTQIAYLNWTGPIGESFPVSDITYEGAQQFCLWLTKKYSEFKKRKYKNAVFRLPSSNEWTYTAQGGAKEKTRFPWQGELPYYYPAHDTARRYYVRYMGSFDTTNGYFWGPSQVNSGYANKFGIINVCGSVSEMVLEKGLYKGGCTVDKTENIGIYAPQEPNRKDPDFFIGFRVAMEVKH